MLFWRPRGPRTNSHNAAKAARHLSEALPRSRARGVIDSGIALLPSITRISRANRDESFAKTAGHLGTESSARNLNSTPAPAIRRRDLRPSAASRGATVGN